MADRVGQQLGDYHLIRLLGRGGFAEVYLGEHVHLGTSAAIKVLHTQVAEEDVTRFRQEARLLANLKHPHIVHVFAFGIHEQIPYLVMDYAPQGNLRTRHSRGTRLPVSTIVDYVKQVAEALQYAHDRKIIHRDIKPENILVGEQGEILLSDFGIALIAQSSRYQSTKDIVGTIAYMAPEQIDGKPCRASDQYALGIVVYEWLCGRPPFQGTPGEIASMHSERLPPPLRGYRDDLSPLVEQVILTALEKEPQKRFASVSAFARALELASDETEIRLRRPSLPPPRRKRPRGVHIALVSVILLILIFGGSFVLRPLIWPNVAALCSNNSQSANITVANLPATGTSPDGEAIGLSEGATIFDRQRPNPQEVQDKLQAAQNIETNYSIAQSSFKDATSADSTDAEAWIYTEDLRVLGSSHPYITLVIGTSFGQDVAQASRSILQGAYTAQKEFNDRNQQDGDTQVVLMIANIGGGDSPSNPCSANFVANQIVSQAAKDKTIVGIMGWPSSGDSININHQLKTKQSTLPMVSPSSSSDALNDMSNFFRVCPPNREEAQMAANFLLNTMHKKRIAILYAPTNAYSNDLEIDFLGDVKNNAESKQYTEYNADSVKNALMGVLNYQPDAIYMPGHVQDLINLLKDISQTPYANLPIVGGDAFAITSNYTTQLPPNIDHVYFTAFASPNEWDNTGQTPPFFQYYQNNFSPPPTPTGLSTIDTNVMLGYDAMYTLLHGTQQVLSKKNIVTPPGLTSALEQITGANAIQGITGRISFDSSGNQQNKTIILEHIEDTSLVVDDSQGCFQLTDNCSS